MVSPNPSTEVAPQGAWEVRRPNRAVGSRAAGEELPDHLRLTPKPTAEG